MTGAKVRVVLPFHLKRLAGIDSEVLLEVAAPVTPAHVLDALEERFPPLRGTVRDYGTGKRRAFLRFFACKRDLSHQTMDTPLPAEVAAGAEPFMIVGAISGG